MFGVAPRPPTGWYPVAPRTKSPSLRIAAALLAGAVALAACHEPDVVRYDGTVTNTTTSRSATAALTVYSRADSFVTGYLSIQGPLEGSGHFVGQRGAAAWRFVVHTATGDTISWSATPLESAPGGTRLGGTYLVVTGEHAGEGGTFELRQTWGRGLEIPPARSSVVATPALTWEPPIVLVVAAAMITLFVLLCGWVLAAPPPGALPAARTPLARELRGVSGWMALFLVGQGLVTLLSFGQLGEVRQSLFGGTWVLAGAIPWMRAVLVAEAVAHVLRMVIAPIGIVATLKRWHGTPRLWFAYLALLGMYAVGDITASASLADSMRLMMGSALGADWRKATDSAMLLNLRLALFVVIWIGYWSRSERVRQTFGRLALDDWRVGVGAWPRLHRAAAAPAAGAVSGSDAGAIAAIEPPPITFPPIAIPPNASVPGDDPQPGSRVEPG